MMRRFGKHISEREPATARRGRRVGVVILSAAMVLTACGGSGDGGGGGGDGETTLTVGLPGLATMDFGPATSDEDNEKILILIGDTLITEDPETSLFAGNLAESWSLSDDGLTWTFKLRPDVKFQGGYGTVTADDVKFSWEQWTSEESTHSVKDIYLRAVSGDMKNFEVVNDLEFKVHTDGPMYDLLQYLCSCNTGMTVFPRKYYEEKGEEAIAHPIGSGPWEYVSSSAGDEIVLKGFKDYWNGAPAADNLVLKEMPDGAARLAQVQAGALDMAQLDNALVNEAEANPDLQVKGIPHVGNAWVLLGGSYWGDDEHLDRDAPWIQADDLPKGKAVREALSYAIDRQAILDTVLHGHGALTYGPVLQYPQIEKLSDPSWKLPVYDPELAKQKLAEGGYPNGFEVTMAIAGSDFDTGAMSEAVAGMWEAIGIKVARKPTEEGVLKQAEVSFETDGLVWVRSTTFRPEPSGSIATYVMDPDLDSKFYYPAINEAYAEMTKESDIDKRYAIARQLIATLEEAKVAPSMMTGDMLFVTNDRIDQWTPIPGLNTVSGLETVTFK